MLNHINNCLSKSIQSVLSRTEEFLLNPDKSFTRQSPLTLETMIRSILGMGGKSLSKELLDLRLLVSSSAYVQRRYQIKHELFEVIFHAFTNQIPRSHSLPILAVDGSDLSIPNNPHDFGTRLVTKKDQKGYNLMHLNALFDLERGIYVDAKIQDKREADERKAFIQMMEASPF